MSSRNPSQQSTAITEREDRVRRVIENCIDRRAAGESVTDEQLIADQPDLMPELENALRLSRLAANAEKAAEHLVADGLHVRCPHCQNPIELVEERSISDLICPSCGSQLSLTDNTESTFQVALGEMVNHFRLEERVGAGAFGSVWSARDTHLDRTVALKIPRKGQMGPEDQEQFIREARSSAQLQHPSIVGVLEVGRFKDRIYIASQFIAGRDLADWLTEQQVTSREAAELCVTMADALQHAHERGVIHRDLKPSNIMMDTSGEPHLMDFGLAKREAAEIAMTLDGKLLGTPAYMSPEQARGDARHADNRSDVYSLGVILFELLTGERPFRGSTRMLLHQVLIEDAPSPSKLNRRIPADIETICLKCLEKDPSHRYQSAGELRDDLQRFLDGQPVHARPITRSARSWRWCKRNPIVSGLAASVASLLVFLAVAGVIVAATQQRLATEARASEKESRRNLAKAKESENKSQRLLAEGYLESGRTACDDGRVAQGLHWFARALAATPPEDKELSFNITDNFMAWSSFAVAPTNIFYHNDLVHDIVYSPDNSKLLTRANGGEVKLWSADSGELIHDLCGHTDNVWIYDFSPDSRRLLTGGLFPNPRLWSVETGETLAILEHESNVMGVAFHPDGSRLVTVTSKWLRVWSGETFEVLSQTEVNQRNSGCAKFSGDGSLLLTMDDDWQSRIWSVEKGEAIGEPVKRGIRSEEFSPDGSMLVIGSTTGDVRVWSTENGELLWEKEHYAGIRHVTFHPQSLFVLSTSEDGSARIWSAKDGSEQTAPLQHGCSVWTGAFLPDGESFVTVDRKAFIRLWSTKTGELLAHPARFDASTNKQFTKVAIRPNSKRMAVCSFESQAFELDISDLWPLAPVCKLEYADGEHGTQGIAFSPDEKRVLTGCWSGPLSLWSLETGESLATLDFGRILDVVRSPNEPIAIVRCDDATMHAVSLKGDQLVKLHTLVQAGRCATFSPDGSSVVTSGDEKENTARVWSTANWDELISVPLGSDIVGAAFSPDGKIVVSLGEDGIAQLWSPTTGQVDGPTFQHSKASVVCVSPDGRRIATGGSDKQVLTWDFATRKPTGIALQHDGPVTNVAYTPDGSRILTATQDGGVYVWSAATGERIGRPIVERDGPAVVAFGSHGNRLLIGDKVGSELWEFGDMRTRAIDDPDEWVQAVTGRKMNSSGTLEWLDRPTWLEFRRHRAK